MANYRLSSLALLLLFAAPAAWEIAFAQASQPPPQGHAVVVTSRRQILRDDTVRRRLKTTVTVDFNKTPLKAALHALARAAGVNLFIDDGSLVAAGYPESTPITLRFRYPVSVANALKFVLIKAQGGSSTRLTYTVSHGVLVVGTADSLALSVVTRCYRLTPLMLVSTRRHPALINRLQVRGIVKLLENTVDRDAWVENSGTINTVQELDSTLVITAGERDQWRIDRVLTALAAQVRRRNKNVTRR